MKRIFFATIILLSTFALSAQKEVVPNKKSTSFYKHELKVSLGPSHVSAFWLQDGICHGNVSITYFYRPEKWFWIGGNVVNFWGNRIYYDWREYKADGSFKDFSKSKIKYCTAIAPEIRCSFLNKEGIILYGAFAGGAVWEFGYDTKWEKYPRRIFYYQVTCFGISGNLGENKNFLFGGELGFGRKGIVCLQFGYRF